MIEILQELLELIPPLTQEEYQQLRANIEREGEIRDPLCVFIDLQGRTILLDGHNRHRIAQDLNLPFSVKVVAGVVTLDDAKMWMLTNQFGKRNLTQVQRLDLAIKYKPIFEKIARERQRTNIGEGKVVKLSDRFSVQEKVGEIAGVGKETVRKFEAVLNNGDDTTREKMRTGVMSIHEAFSHTRKREGTLRKLELRGSSTQLETEMNRLDRQSPSFDGAVLPKVELGQWWRLGNHFLYVGDSSSPDFYESKFCQWDNGFELAFADPPYGADAADWDGIFVWNHDYLSDIARVVAVTPGHYAMHDFHKKTTMPYKWTIGYWVKNGMSPSPVGLANFNSIVLFSNGSLHQKEQDFWRILQDNPPIIEATVKTSQKIPFKGPKPFEVVARLLDMYVEDNGLVIDPFGGSGTTLFVAEQQGKTCVMAEILPTHASQIIHRFEALTGWKAQLL